MFVNLLKDVAIFKSELEHWLVVRLQLLIRVAVGSRPFSVIEVKIVVEDLGVEQGCQLNVLLEQINQVVLEQMTVEVWVLILYDVFDHQWNWSNLVVLKGNVDWRLSVLVFEEKWVLWVEEIFVFLTQQSFDGPWVKCQICHHILEPELEEHFEEYLWIWLSPHKHFNLTLSLARVDTLKKE